MHDDREIIERLTTLETNHTTYHRELKKLTEAVEKLTEVSIENRDNRASIARLRDDFRQYRQAVREEIDTLRMAHTNLKHNIDKKWSILVGSSAVIITSIELFFKYIG